MPANRSHPQNCQSIFYGLQLDEYGLGNLKKKTRLVFFEIESRLLIEQARSHPTDDISSITANLWFCCQSRLLCLAQGFNTSCFDADTFHQAGNRRSLNDLKHFVLVWVIYKFRWLTRKISSKVVTQLLLPTYQMRWILVNSNQACA